MNAILATAQEPSLDVSVVICTYNRAAQLRQALEPLAIAAAQTQASVEIVIVDNNSNDDTKAVVDAFAKRSPIAIRYVFESAQGLSFARNRGLAESKGRVTAFTDDDCIVDEHWIDALWSEFVSHPEICIFGGRVDLFTAADKPVSIRPIDERVRYTNASQIYGLIIGCNLAVRRGLAERIGGFDPAFGGTKGVVADDIEFVYRGLRQGFGVLYSPNPRVFHNHGRRTVEDLRRLNRSYVKGRGAFFCKYILKADAAILRHAWWELRAQFRSRSANADNLSSAETFGALASGALHFALVRARLVRP